MIFRSLLLVLGSVGAWAETWDLSAHSTASVQKTWFPHALDDTAEIWGSNWHSRYFDHEAAADYEALDPFFSLELGAKWANTWNLQVELPLRRDAWAWTQDPMGLNWAMSADELDLNVPKSAYLSTNQPLWAFKLGRYSPGAGDSLYRVAYSGKSWQDAVEFRLGKPAFHYQVRISSLNPWLVGDPVLQTGEWALQNQSAVPNQHGRIYNEPYKTLADHSLAFDLGIWSMGLRELALVGGVAPSLRTVQPLMFLHNNFSDGLNNTLFAWESSLHFKWQGQQLHLGGEFALDDLQAGSGEESGDTPMIQAHRMDLRWTGDFDLFKALLQLQWVQTDPAYGNSALPLLRMSDRHVSRSNSRLREEPGYFDTYIADLPLGYFRGPSCRDFWLEAALNRGPWSVNFRGAYLQKGSFDLRSDWQTAVSAPGGFYTSKEGRAALDLSYRSPNYVWKSSVERRDLDRGLWHLALSLSGNWKLVQVSFEP